MRRGHDLKNEGDAGPTRDPQDLVLALERKILAKYGLNMFKPWDFTNCLFKPFENAPDICFKENMEKN